MSKLLSPIELKAAELMSAGLTESQIAEACGKSRSWVQRLKRRADFQELVGHSSREITQAVRQVIVEDVRNSLTEDLEEFRQRYGHASTLIYELAVSYLEKLKQRMISGLGLQTTTQNLQDIEILGGGRILFKNSKPDAARGIESLVDCFFDEFAFVDEAKLIFDAVSPAQQMVDDSRVFVVSTPNRKNNFYWDLLSQGNGDKDIELICHRMSKGEEEPFQYWVDSGGWGKLAIHWKAHPKYGQNPNFLQEVHEKQKLSWETIRQEYDLNFEESAESLFSADIVRRGADGILESDRQDNASYYLGVDTSALGSDYFVGLVLKELDGLYSVVYLYRKR